MRAVDVVCSPTWFLRTRREGKWLYYGVNGQNGPVLLKSILEELKPTSADLEKIAEVLPALKKRAFEMYEEGERLTGHKGLPLEFTPNLAAAE